MVSWYSQTAEREVIEIRWNSEAPALTTPCKNLTAAFPQGFIFRTQTSLPWNFLTPTEKHYRKGPDVGTAQPPTFTVHPHPGFCRLATQSILWPCTVIYIDVMTRTKVILKTALPLHRREIWDQDQGHDLSKLTQQQRQEPTGHSFVVTSMPLCLTHITCSTLNSEMKNRTSSILAPIQTLTCTNLTFLSKGPVQTHGIRWEHTGKEDEDLVGTTTIMNTKKKSSWFLKKGLKMTDLTIDT